MRDTWIGLVALGIGAAFTVSGIYVSCQRLGFLGRCLEARATVTDFHWEEQVDAGPEGGGPVKVGWPVFRFIDLRSGVEVEALGSVGSPHPPYSLGQEVVVLYDPEDLDSRVVVKSFWNLWLLSIVLALIASVNVLIGVLAIRAGRAQTGLLRMAS